MTAYLSAHRSSRSFLAMREPDAKAVPGPSVVLLLVLCLHVEAGCGLGKSQQPNPVSMFDLFVCDSQTGLPIEGAKVKINISTVTTDAEGKSWDYTLDGAMSLGGDDFRPMKIAWSKQHQKWLIIDDRTFEVSAPGYRPAWGHPRSNASWTDFTLYTPGAKVDLELGYGKQRSRARVTIPMVRVVETPPGNGE